MLTSTLWNMGIGHFPMNNFKAYRNWMFLMEIRTYLLFFIYSVWIFVFITKSIRLVRFGPAVAVSAKIFVRAVTYTFNTAILQYYNYFWQKSLLSENLIIIYNDFGQSFAVSESVSRWSTGSESATLIFTWIYVESKLALRQNKCCSLDND